MSQLAPYQQHLQALVPLNRLTQERRDAVLAKSELREYRTDSFVYREGDDDDNLYYLLKGTVSLYWRHKPIKQIAGGSVASKRAFDRPGTKRHSIRAETDSLIAIIPSETLARQMREANLLHEASLEVSDIAAEKSSNWMIRLLQSALFADLPARNIQRVFS